MQVIRQEGFYKSAPFSVLEQGLNEVLADLAKLEWDLVWNTEAGLKHSSAVDSKKDIEKEAYDFAAYGRGCLYQSNVRLKQEGATFWKKCLSLLQEPRFLAHLEQELGEKLDIEYDSIELLKFQSGDFIGMSAQESEPRYFLLIDMTSDWDIAFGANLQFLNEGSDISTANSDGLGTVFVYDASKRHQFLWTDTRASTDRIYVRARLKELAA